MKIPGMPSNRQYVPILRRRNCCDRLLYLFCHPDARNAFCPATYFDSSNKENGSIWQEIRKFRVKLRSPCEFFRCVLQQSGFQPALVCRTQCIMTPAR